MYDLIEYLLKSKFIRKLPDDIKYKNRLDFEAQIEISKKAKLGKRTTKKSVEMMMKKF